MDSIRSFTNNCWNKCPSLSAFCPDSETPSRIAQCVKNTFSASSFSSIKDSKWTYIVLASAITLLTTYKIFQLRSQIASLTIASTDAATKIKTAEKERDEAQKKYLASETCSEAFIDFPSGMDKDELKDFFREKFAKFVTVCEKNLSKQGQGDNVEIPRKEIDNLFSAVNQLSQPVCMYLFPDRVSGAANK